MRPTQKRSIMFTTLLVLSATACGGDGSDPSADASATTAGPTSSAETTEPSATTASRPPDASELEATTTTADVEDSTYVTKAFVMPFEVTVPGWLPNAPSVDWPNFVTWESTSPADPAVRFLVPLNVYPPGATGIAPPPEDYLSYLLAQTAHGATFADETETTVGGKPATVVTATVLESLDGSLGCQAEALTAEDCFGLQPNLTLRIAVIDAGDTTLLAWLRHDRDASGDDATDEFASFEQMLASVRFVDGEVSVPATVPVATPIDGAWTTSVTYDELANSPLLYDQTEVNDGNWGEWTFTFEQGRFTGTQENPTGTSSISGTFRVEGDTIELTLDNSEHFLMRWSVEGDELTFERDDSIGIAPTPFLINPWNRER